MSIMKIDRHVCVFNRCRRKYELPSPPLFLFTFHSFHSPVSSFVVTTRNAGRGKTAGEGITRSCLANICTINREKCHLQEIASNCTAELIEERLVLHRERACTRLDDRLGAKSRLRRPGRTTHEGVHCFRSS